MLERQASAPNSGITRISSLPNAVGARSPSQRTSRRQSSSMPSTVAPRARARWGSALHAGRSGPGGGGNHPASCRAGRCGTAPRTRSKTLPPVPRGTGGGGRIKQRTRHRGKLLGPAAGRLNQVETKPQHGIIQHAGFQVYGGFGQNTADLFAVLPQVVHPFDLDGRAAQLLRCTGSGNCGQCGDLRGLAGAECRPQQNAQVQPARRGEEAVPAPPAPADWAWAISTRPSGAPLAAWVRSAALVPGRRSTTVICTACATAGVSSAVMRPRSAGLPRGAEHSHGW